jgi:hypothetical protein
MSLDSDVEERLGQALAAFGQGSGAIRIPRAMVTAFQETFRDSFRDVIQSDPKAFEAKASYVLDVFRTLGSLAANLATAAGSVSIEPRYFRQAFVIVQAAERAKNGDKPTQFCGKAPLD